VSRTPGRRVRVGLASLAAIGLAVAAASPALADTATPITPTQLITAGQACVTDQSAAQYFNTNDGLEIEAAAGLSDGNPVPVSTEYQLWPVSDPADVSSWSLASVPDYDNPFIVPSGDFTDGQTYAWDAASAADGETSAFSTPCYLIVDDTYPANPPTVTSSNYSSTGENQGGAPVQVTFSANGVSDVAGYAFNWVGTASGQEYTTPSDPDTDVAGAVRASTVGGSVTLNLIPPSAEWPLSLSVISLDRAGNPSPPTTYSFSVDGDAPTVALHGKLPTYGAANVYDLTPNAALEAQSPVVSYNVQVVGDPNGQQNYTVAANADGTATTQITLDSNYGEWVQVSSVSADGWTSALGDYQIVTTPTVSSDVYTENGTSGGVGVAGTFTFAPPVKDVASYSYSFDYGTTQTIVPAHHGKAQLSWTPTASGSYDIEVYAILKDGTELYPYDYFFNVA
jgi:hypothetical protein